MENTSGVAVFDADAVGQSTVRLFGPGTPIDGENTASHEELLARVNATLKPSDIFEEMWAREVVELAWEAFRLRRLKSNLLKAKAQKGMFEVLMDIGAVQAWDTAREWRRRNQAAIDDVDTMLGTAGLGIDAVMAQALALTIDEFERFDRMIMLAEARRNSVLHEIERHRATFAQRLRGAIGAVEDAEFKVIAPQDAPAMEPA